MATTRSAFLRAVALTVVLAAAPTPGHTQQQPPAPKPGQAAAAIEDPVLAVVGDVEIRESDLLAELNRQIPLVYYHQKVPEDQLDGLRKKSLAILIEKQLIFQDAVGRNLKVTDEEIRAEMKKAVANAGEEYAKITDAKFESLLQEFRPQARRRLLIAKNEERFQQSVPKPDDAAVASVYERMQRDDSPALKTPPEAHLLHVFVAVDPSCDEKTFAEKQARIESAQKQLEAGKDFAAVAKEISEDESAKNGGDLGTVKQGHFGKARDVDAAAFALKAGETSKVVRSLYGFHILRCLEVVPPRQRTIAELRPMLEEWFSTEHHRQRRELWLKELRERIGVKYLVPELAMPEAAVPNMKKPGKAGTDAPAATGK